MSWFRATVGDYLAINMESVVNQLASKSAERFVGDQRAQMRAWREQLQLLTNSLLPVTQRFSFAREWGIIVEYPLLRLQRRLDAVLLAGDIVAVVEFKVGENVYALQDADQVTDYCLDLRDFHAASTSANLLPVLCATKGGLRVLDPIEGNGLLGIRYVNAETLSQLIFALAERQQRLSTSQIDLDGWAAAAYRPVPTIIEAAELLYSGHNVAEIASSAADAENLGTTTKQIIKIIRDAKSNKRKTICFVTGIPGSGKTLVGLNAVHDSSIRELAGKSSAFLSGNTPLVHVLREALARDHSNRTGNSRKDARHAVKSEIQGLMSFLEQYLKAEPNSPPHEHVVVFDEAQRAWDAEYGEQRFNRAASEPALFLEIMGRHSEWAVIIALVGNGQEINRGEQGLQEWGKALLNYHEQHPTSSWDVEAPPIVLSSSKQQQWQTLFPEDSHYPGIFSVTDHLHLRVAIRSYKCEILNAWIDCILRGQLQHARQLTVTADFPVYVTRSLDMMRRWLNTQAQGTRRAGLVASSGARRLRADGLGVSLNAQELSDVVHWYLQPKGDVRSSCALEVTANEYTCQGLELDYVGVCWAGDFLWDPELQEWKARAFSGTRWQCVGDDDKRDYIRNKYRVLLSRSRSAMVIWIPSGAAEDETRLPGNLDPTYAALVAAGAKDLALIDEALA